MRKLPPGLWNDLAVKFNVPASSKAGAGGSGDRPGKKRRHQRQPRVYPIQLEPLEQRQLLSTSVTGDLFAATSGTSFNSSPFPSLWTTVNPTGQTPYIVDDQLLITNGHFSTYYLANGTANTISSVQQMSFSATGYNSAFGLVARSDSIAHNFYGMELGQVGTGNTAVLSIFKSVANNQTTLTSVTLSSLGALTYGTQYNLKFLVQTDPVNSSLTDLDADVWAQGTTDPGWLWPVSGTGDFTDGTNEFNGGAYASGYDGIWSNPNYNGDAGSGNTSNLFNYVESDTPTSTPSNDLPEITSFTSSPAPFSSSGTVTFNASATAPVNVYVGGPVESISSYSLNFGDGSSALTSSAAMVNVTHTYTSIPGFAYAPTLTVTDSNGGNATQQIWAVTNTSVTTDPTASLVVDRDGGNGVKASNPLIVHFITSGTASSSDPLADYILNFGDGSPIMSVPVSGGSDGEIWTLDTDHAYSSKGTFDATLTVVGTNGAATVKAQSIFTTNSASAPTVTPSYNTSTNILTAVFSEDVGAALADQFNSSGTPLGQQIWSDGASTVNTLNATNVSTGVNLQVPGSFAAALDIRNDNSGGSISLAGETFSYNSSDFTATWNLASLTTPLNTSSTSYTARLFATDIQDQAGNDLDGINSGIGGQDIPPIHFGHSYTTLSSTSSPLASNGVWNSSMPLVFASSILLRHARWAHHPQHRHHFDQLHAINGFYRR